MTEEPLQFGEGGRLFGILTLPIAPPHTQHSLPVFVFLSAGLLHRVGPARLHVRLARALAQMGFSSLRVDLAGVGDSLQRPGLTNQQSVAADYAEIVTVLESRLGRVSMVLGGLCAGADNAIRLTATDRRVVGMLLLDPVCFSNEGLNTRALLARHVDPRRYIAWVRRRLNAAAIPLRERWKRVDGLTLRDVPTVEQLRAAFEVIRERDGRVLSVFTQHAFHGYYDRFGQLERAVAVENYARFCTELFWPDVEHTYMLDVHRRRLIEEVTRWAAGFLRPQLDAVGNERTEHDVRSWPA